MRKVLLLIYVSLLAPACVLAYQPPIVEPESPTTVHPIKRATESQEYFGKLNGFPHTFEFAVGETAVLDVRIFVPDLPGQENDISIIMVKDEHRGVSEVGRTAPGKQSWTRNDDPLLTQTFAYGGNIQEELTAGTYKLEVSSPNNDGAYRLVLGEGEVKRGYIENVQVLFATKKLYGASYASAFLSPLVYVPIIVVILIAIGACFHRRRR